VKRLLLRALQGAVWPRASQRNGFDTLSLQFFLDDLRISTNVRLFEDIRALGTRVSAEVRKAVLIDGRTWLDRAFVVNDWYISAYQPISDSFGERVGMLYVGFLEAPFAEAKRAAFWWMLAAFFAVLALSAPVFLWLARGIFSPLERMTKVMHRVGKGELSARIGRVPARDEIGAVAQHLDWLLEQVQERDRQLRSWNDALNQRVDQRTAELREANEKLEQTFRQLVMSEKLASIGEITAGVAHEINNPVAVIMGNVDVIRQTLGDNAEPVATELALIDKQVSRIEVIVGKLLKFAAPSEFSDCEHNIALRPLVQDCLVLVDHLISRGGVEVHCAFEEVPPVRADSGEVQQVVVNLVVNAVQAMQGAGRLDLHLAEAERAGVAGVALSVSDSGPGVPDDLLGSLFDPFFTTKEKSTGTGLGLATAYGIIRSHGGLINLRSKKGKGTTFNIYLPASAKEIVQEEEFSGEVMKGTETVLLVDDEETIAEVGQELLETLGYTVLPAMSGKEAIEIYKKNKDEIDMVLLDMIMPEMGGSETYDRLKKINPDIKVLLSSGYS
ncbi:hypothetical protein LCGC14_2346410, partial [marine sediment metagenome]